MSPYAQGCFGGVFWHVDYLFCGEYSELHRMLNAGVSVDFINTKAAIRGSAWHRQTEQLRTLHPNNYRRLYRDLAWDCFFGGVYLYFFLLWTICSAECLGVFFAAAVMLWGETFTLVLWISLAVAKCFVYSPGEKKILLKLFLSSKRLFLPTHKHVDEKQDTGGLKTITEESAPLLLKQLDTLCQAEPAKAEIPGSSDSSSNHPTASGSHIPLSHPWFPPSFPKIKQGHAFISQSLAS